MHKLLYISSNDGSDMRINKELKSLSGNIQIYFLGIGKFSDKNYASQYCEKFYLIDEKRNSLKAIIKQVFKYINLVNKYEFKSIHIINEQLMVFFYPFLFKNYVVLDVFDSIFLKKSYLTRGFNALKHIVYLPTNKILVTDSDRKKLMPNFVQNKIEILENYPNCEEIKYPKLENDELTIFYGGTLNNTVGTQILQQLLKIHPNIKIIMAGWISDENTKQFATSNSVDYRGVLKQNEALKIASESDYIMCCYEPINNNHIYASPNKIYDSIHVSTPLIINSEVKISEFVRHKDIGVVLNSFYFKNTENVYKELIEKKGKFNFNNIDPVEYTWESIEKKLFKVHNINIINQ